MHQEKLGTGQFETSQAVFSLRYSDYAVKVRNANADVKASSPVRAEQDFVSIHQHVLVTERARDPPEGQTKSCSLQYSDSDVLPPRNISDQAKIKLTQAAGPSVDTVRTN